MNRLMKVSCLMIAGSAAAFSHQAYGQAGTPDPTALAAERLQLRTKIGSACNREGLGEHRSHCINGKLVVCLNQVWTLKDSWNYMKCKDPVYVQRESWVLGSVNDSQGAQSAIQPEPTVAVNIHRLMFTELNNGQTIPYDLLPPTEGSSCSVGTPSPWQTTCYDGRFAVCLNGQWAWKDRWLFLSSWDYNGSVVLRTDGAVRKQSQGYRSIIIDSCQHDRRAMDEIQRLPRQPGDPVFVPEPRWVPGFVGVTKSRARAKTGISIRELILA